ncbi:MGDG synthase family glycosyltransferase [Alicyclobacillus dauci]|uniref:Galactosyldiacylglycerol synthase n=1 Tax=Alicyclobacillus dauci TaxID=1475485 RepID=A0ABY6Z7T3_9BACL|nr:glycosyltransferase [Alicyclobacillus dauci]WAH38800.1 galactosyldiacylglycerol synthase [Alicyclobacillus dauci]
MRVLLMYASFGDGHLQVANAMAHVLETEHGAEVIRVDSFRQTNGLMARMNEWLYESLTQFAPGLYGMSYTLTRNLSPNHPLWGLLALFSRAASWRELRRHKPDIVVQLFPDHAMARLPKDLEVTPFLATVCTDFAVHSRWFHRNTNLYILPSDVSFQAAKRFLARMTNRDVVVTGLPVREQFMSCQLNSQLPRPTIIVSAGGRGVFPNLREVVRCLLNSFPNHGVSVLCGRNERMREQLEEMATSTGERERLNAVGYTDNIASWIQQADFAVAKAGGISIAECLCSGTPMLFYKPQAGQELGNAIMVEQMGAARVAKSIRQFESIVQSFRGEHLNNMRDACYQHACPSAAVATVTAILSKWEEPQH